MNPKTVVCFLHELNFTDNSGSYSKYKLQKKSAPFGRLISYYIIEINLFHCTVYFHQDCLHCCLPYIFHSMCISWYYHGHPFF